MLALDHSTSHGTDYSNVDDALELEAIFVDAQSGRNSRSDTLGRDVCSRWASTMKFWIRMNGEGIKVLYGIDVEDGKPVVRLTDSKQVTTSSNVRPLGRFSVFHRLI